MVDERLEQLSEIEDAEATLRDGDGTVELSASDIVAVEQADGDSTQIMERSELEQAASADSTAENLGASHLRTTMEVDANEGMTTELQVPEALLHETAPKTQKMQAVGTQQLPKIDVIEAVDGADEANIAEETAVRGTDSGEWAELDDEGFYTFIARVDDEGRVKLPEVLFGGRDPADGVTVFVRAKML